LSQAAGADLFLKALIVLPEDAVIAFHLAEGLLFIADDCANAALSHLINAGIRAEVIAMETTVT
jgi:hypothetical protein